MLLIYKIVVNTDNIFIFAVEHQGFAANKSLPLRPCATFNSCFYDCYITLSTEKNAHRITESFWLF